MHRYPLDEHGLLLRREALELGYDDNWLGRMVRANVLVRIRHGAYAAADVWQRAGRVERHLLLSRAVMRRYDDRVALSHASAHVMRGGPDWGVDLSTVNITNLFGHGDRRQAGITHHRGIARVGDITRMDDHWATAPARTAVETAAQLPLAPAVCVLDWTLHQGLATPAELETYAAVHLREWPDTIELPVAVRRSNGLSESVGETRTRLALEDHGLEPELQWIVRLPSGRIVARIDLVLRDLGVMIEFDGQIKYGRLLRPGQRIEDVIKAERDRELLAEEITGLRMMRVVWPDLDDEDRLIQRIERVARQRRSA